MKTLIKNFCDNSPIEIQGRKNEEFGPLITIYQSHGAMSFQHDMKPHQAREMAAALIACADELEPIIADLVAA